MESKKERRKDKKKDGNKQIKKDGKEERKNTVGQRSRHILKKSQALCVAVTYQPEPLQG